MYLENGPVVTLAKTMHEGGTLYKNPQGQVVSLFIWSAKLRHSLYLHDNRVVVNSAYICRECVITSFAALFASHG